MVWAASILSDYDGGSLCREQTAPAGFSRWVAFLSADAKLVGSLERSGAIGGRWWNRSLGM